MYLFLFFSHDSYNCTIKLFGSNTAKKLQRTAKDPDEHRTTYIKAREQCRARER